MTATPAVITPPFTNNLTISCTVTATSYDSDDVTPHDSDDVTTTSTRSGVVQENSVDDVIKDVTDGDSRREEQGSASSDAGGVGFVSSMVIKKATPTGESQPIAAVNVHDAAHSLAQLSRGHVTGSLDRVDGVMG